MIVRVQSEGQYRLSDGQVATLQGLDNRLIGLIDGQDEQAIHAAVVQIVDFVRTEGEPLSVEDLASSDVILPASDASVAEIRDLINADGLIPG